MVEATQLICQLGRLKVDPAKTWLWASNKDEEDSCRLALRELFPKDTIDRVQGAKDLGMFMQYSGRARLGSLVDRLTEGHSRLQRMQYQPWDIQVKTHVVCSAVYPAAFHGAEVFPIGQQHLDRFRSKTAEAILQLPNTSMSPVIFFMALPSKLVDPALFVIQQALEHARFWLLQASLESQTAFFYRVAVHKGTIGSSKGPASALSMYLERIGWSINKQGQVSVGDFVQLNLLTCSIAELRHWSSRAWHYDAILCHTSRFSLRGYPAVDRTSTVQVLKQMPPATWRLLLRFISQAYQPGNQRASWNGPDAEFCDFCAAPDNKTHRFLCCPVFESIRDRHAQAVHLLEHEHPEWIDVPLIFEQPFTEYIHTLHYQMVEPTLPHEHIQQISTLCSAPPSFFTDGSCQFPDKPAGRFASFSIVLDTALSDQERQHQVERYLTTGRMPTTLTAVAKGRVPGRQDIHRAELLAIVLICESEHTACIHSDSQVALKAISLARSATVQEVQSHPDFDLILRLKAVLQPGHEFRKIQAHQQVTLDMPVAQAYESLGNQLANDTASDTAWNSTPGFAKDLRNRAEALSTTQTNFA